MLECGGRASGIWEWPTVCQAKAKRDKTQGIEDGSLNFITKLLQGSSEVRGGQGRIVMGVGLRERGRKE